MTTAPTIPTPDFGNTAPRKGSRRKWWFAGIGLVLVFAMWKCGTALYEARGLANAAVAHFHAQLNSGQYEEIYREADAAFSEPTKHDKLLHFFDVVHRRLGDAVSADQMTNLNVNSTTSGTFVTAHYRTTFAQGSAEETFTWRKNGKILQLYKYNIASDALLE